MTTAATRRRPWAGQRDQIGPAVTLDGAGLASRYAPAPGERSTRIGNLDTPLGAGTVRVAIDVYLAQVAAAVAGGQAVEIPHLGRLRLGAVGAVIFEPAPGLIPNGDGMTTEWPDAIEEVRP